MATAHLARSPTVSWLRTAGHLWLASGATTITTETLTSSCLAAPAILALFLGPIVSITATVTAPLIGSALAALRLTSGIRGRVPGATMTTMVFWIYSWRISISRSEEHTSELQSQS